MGSEMCIRDRRVPSRHRGGWASASNPAHHQEHPVSDPILKTFEHSDGRKAIMEKFQEAEFKAAGFKEIVAKPAEKIADKPKA